MCISSFTEGKILITLLILSTKYLNFYILCMYCILGCLMSKTQFPLPQILYTLKHKCATANNCWHIICIIVYFYSFILCWVEYILFSVLRDVAAVTLPYLVNCNEDWLFLVTDISVQQNNIPVHCILSQFGTQNVRTIVNLRFIYYLVLGPNYRNITFDIWFICICMVYCLHNKTISHVPWTHFCSINFK